MVKKYRVTFGVRTSNAIVTALLRVGVKLRAPGGFGEMTLLTVRGRKSGVPRTVPVVMGVQGVQRWLVSPFGEVNWARNLRAAGEGIVTRGRRAETITVKELSASEAAPSSKDSSLAGRHPWSARISRSPQHPRSRTSSGRRRAIPSSPCDTARDRDRDV